MKKVMQLVGTVLITSLIFSVNTLAQTIDVDVLQEPTVLNLEGNNTELIESLEIEGYSKTYDETTDMYVFTPDDTNQYSSITLDDFSIEEKDEDINYYSDDFSDNKNEITIDEIVADNKLFANESSIFSFDINNYSSEELNNIELLIQVDGNLIDNINVERIAGFSAYEANIELSGIPEGNHIIEIVTDENRDIALVNKTFNWETRASGLPDLTASIDSPQNNSDIKGPKNSNDKIEVNFKIINQGNAAAGGSNNFLCTIYVNNKSIQGFFVSEIPAMTAIAGKFDISLGTYADTKLSLEADSLDEIEESNENNNLVSNNYYVYYCTHYSTANKKRSKSSDLLVRIDPTAMSGNITQNLIVKSLSAWNGITDSCSITKAVVSSSNQKEDIAIFGQTSNSSASSAIDFDVFAETTPNGTRSMICLFTNALGKTSDNQILRTIRHELGHAYGLDHPSCNYNALMMQSGNDPNLNYIVAQPHDKYNLHSLYDGRDSDTRSIYSIKSGTKVVRTDIEFTSFVEDIEDLENKADYIIRATILPDSENVLFNEYGGYTKTKLEVKQVFKGDLEEGSIIDFREPYYSMIDDLGDQCEVFSGDYTKSIVGKDYILFLSKYSDAELYGLRNNIMGRYLADDVSVYEIEDSNLILDEIYYDIYYQVLDKYI